MLGSAWSARGLAIIAGVCAALAFPPFGFLPGLLGYGLLLKLAERPGERPLRSAFFMGWLAGIGYFSVGVWWIVEAFLVDAEVHGWMAPFALFLMAGGLAIFWGLATLIYRAIGSVGGGRILVFAGTLSGFEWLRGHVFTGFPWNLPGETWAAGSPLSQVAALVGAYGLTFLTVYVSAAPATLLDIETKRTKFIPIALAGLCLVSGYVWGAMRLATAPQTSGSAPLIRLVQANIDQKDKWRPENLSEIVATYLRLSIITGPQAPDIVVWPEGALPVVVEDLFAGDSRYRVAITRSFSPGQTLLMGSNRAELGPAREVAYFNSLIAMRAESGRLVRIGQYDKHRLVPFGEFLPFGDLAGRLGIRALVHMPGDFTAGPDPRPLALAGLPVVQPLICYEAVFPGFANDARRRSGVRAAWILNISNDAWFGATSGPWQHLNIAGYRAIEEGLPIARATPTGVTAMIDGYGRVQQKIGLGREGILDARLPPALIATPYARHGEMAFWLMVLGAGFVPMWARRPLLKFG